MTKGELARRIRAIEVTLSQALEDRAMWDKAQPEAFARNTNFVENLREHVRLLKVRRAKL